MSDSLRLHESQDARPPCLSPTPRVYSNSCPSSRWCHPAISSSVIPFSSCPQSLPASGSSTMSQLFAWGGQSIGVSASASVLLMNTQDWSPLGWTGWISLQSKGLSRVFSNTTVQKSVEELVIGNFCCLSVYGGTCSWLMLNTNLNIYLKYEHPLNLVIINIIKTDIVFLPGSLRYNWYTILYRFKVYNEMDTHIYWEMTIIIKLVNISITSHNYHFLCVW